MGIKVGLVLNKGAMNRHKKQLDKAQDYIDSECIRLMTPYVPVARDEFKGRGRLRNSAKVLSPGKIVYTAPFARSDYYAVKDHKPPHGGNPEGRRLWFEYMKVRHAAAILRKAAAIAGGKVE